jgi:hypothetical protein
MVYDYYRGDGRSPLIVPNGANTEESLSPNRGQLLGIAVVGNQSGVV